MKKEYADRFASTAREVLTEIIKARVTADTFTIERDLIKSQGVAIVIVLIGKLRGRILIDMSQDTAIGIAELMNGETIKSYNTLVRDTVIEIGNLIAGRYVTVLRNTMVTDIEMALPILFSGEEMDILDTYPDAVAVSLETEFGTVEMNISLM